MAWDFKDPLVSTPCYMQSQQPPDQAAQSHIQPGLECLQGWGIHILFRQPVPVRHHPLVNFLLTSKLNLPCLSLKPFPLVLSLSTLINSHSPSCLYVPFKYWKATMRSPWSLLLSKLNKPSSLNLSLGGKVLLSLWILFFPLRKLIATSCLERDWNVSWLLSKLIFFLAGEKEVWVLCSVLYNVKMFRFK